MKFCKSCRHDIAEGGYCLDCLEGSLYENINGEMCSSCADFECPETMNHIGTACDQFRPFEVGCEGNYCEMCCPETRKECG